MVTIVKGKQKAPFSIATTPRCRGGCYSFPWIAPLHSWYVPYIAECWARRYQVPFLKSLLWLDLGLNPGLPDHWQTLYPLGQWAVILYFLNDVNLLWLFCDLMKAWSGFYFTNINFHFKVKYIYWIYCFHTNLSAHLAGAVEYTDCISAGK